MDRTVHVVESHDQVYHLWKRQGITGQAVLHLDFHCDLRGLLIHRKRQLAYPIRDRYSDLDEGNFLTHAIRGGMINRVRWIHDNPGGRQHDLKTVKYETDLSAVVHRLLARARRTRGIPVDYQVLTASAWDGKLLEGEILDIDWDYFACRDYAIDSIPDRIRNFLDSDFAHAPRHAYVCYSPNYSHPTRAQFRQFVHELADRLEASVVETAAAEASTPTPNRSTIFRSARYLYHRAGLALRRRGIY